MSITLIMLGPSNLVSVVVVAVVDVVVEARLNQYSALNSVSVVVVAVVVVVVVVVFVVVVVAVVVFIFRAGC